MLGASKKDSISHVSAMPVCFNKQCLMLTAFGDFRQGLQECQVLVQIQKILPLLIS